MKKSRFLGFVCMVVSVAMLLLACGAPDGYEYNDSPQYYFEKENVYSEIFEHGFVDVLEDNNKSYISLSPNTAAYSDLRRQILDGNSIDRDSVKIEEMINYFSYDYALPLEDKPLSMSGLVMDTPWNEESKLLMVGMRAEDIVASDKTNNMVLLVDVSGSMNGSDRLGLAVQGLILMVDEMTENDTISIVTYSGKVSTVLDGANGTQKELIRQKLLGLKASGSTAGGSAITNAYEIAAKYKDDHDNSTILMVTDGDFNVGVTSIDQLEGIVSEYKNQGISFSAAGVGYGNYKDATLQRIVDAGGGRLGYLSSLVDANKFLVEELDALQHIVARDAKAEIAFNPDVVAKYRIIGYENRQLTEDEWLDEDTNAGSIGSGLMITAVYEIILANDESINEAGETDTGASANFATVTLKYKTPDLVENRTDSFVITPQHVQGNENVLETKIKDEDGLFVASIIETALILRDSVYKGSASYEAVYSRLASLLSDSTDQYKKDFQSLVEILLERV